MANFTTVRDLRADALWIAGEASTSASSYYARSLEYLNAVLIALMAGGPLGALDLQAVDWWWAYQTKSAKLAITNAQNTSGTPTGVTATIPNGSTTITFSGNVTQSLVGYRLAFLDDQDQLLHITAHTGGTATATCDFADRKSTRLNSSHLVI